MRLCFISLLKTLNCLHSNYLKATLLNWSCTRGSLKTPAIASKSFEQVSLAALFASMSNRASTEGRKRSEFGSASPSMAGMGKDKKKVLSYRLISCTFGHITTNFNFGNMKFLSVCGV